MHQLIIRMEGCCGWYTWALRSSLFQSDFNAIAKRKMYKTRCSVACLPSNANVSFQRGLRFLRLMFVISLRFLSGNSMTLTYGSDVPDRSLAASSHALMMRKLSVSVCNHRDTHNMRPFHHALNTHDSNIHMCPCTSRDGIRKSPLNRVYTRTHVARKHVSRMSNLYSGYTYVDGHMSPDTSCSFGILVDCISAT